MQFTSPQEIDFNSYQIFLRQLYQLGKLKNLNFCGLFCEETSPHPLFLAWQYEQVKQELQKGIILPQSYNTSKFVERKNIEKVVIKYNELRDHIINKELAIKPLSLKDIISSLNPQSSTLARQNTFTKKVTEIQTALNEQTR